MPSPEPQDRLPPFGPLSANDGNVNGNDGDWGLYFTGEMRVCDLPLNGNLRARHQGSHYHDES